MASSRDGLSWAAELEHALDVFFSPRASAAAVTTSGPLRVAALVLAVLILPVAVGGAGAMSNMIAAEAGAAVSGWVRAAIILGVPFSLVLQAAKVCITGYIVWAILVFTRPLPFRQVLSGALHGELIIAFGGLLTAAVMIVWPQLAGEDPILILGLNRVVPGVPSASPLGAVLARVTPFVLWWGAYLYLWLRAHEIGKGLAIGVIAGIWSLGSAIAASVAAILGAA